jgi:hypothetical protein
LRLVSFRLSWLLIIGASGLSPAQEPPSNTASRYEQALRKIESDEFDERQVGSAELAGLPSEAIALVRATLKKADLELEVRTRLESALPKLRRKARKEELARNKAAFQTWTLKTTLEAYEAVGLKDPKWDAQAREALRLISLIWSEPKTKQLNPALRAYRLCEEAAQAGCDDPLVMYVRAWTYDSAVRKDYMEALRLQLHAARLMKEKGQKYPPIRQAFSFVRAAEFFARLRQETPENDHKAIQDLLDLALVRFGEAAREVDVPDSILLECGNVVAVAWKYLDKDRKVGIDKVDEVFSEARPGGTLPLLFKGSSYFSYAWDARGNGWANTVTTEGWKLMKERLAIAEAALTKAWENKPDDPEAPTLMLGVELGQGRGMGVMETWFKRAMEADPDNLEACRKKMYYLEPKWHGSPEHMVAFGRSLLAGGNWDARLPFQLIDAHLTLAGYGKDRASYYKSDDVWKDVKAVYDGYLGGHPDAVRERSWFAKLACWCGHFDEARKQFQELGDQAAVSAFASQAEMDALRAEAAEKGR